jgi:hypothetical protein
MMKRIRMGLIIMMNISMKYDDAVDVVVVVVVVDDDDDGDDDDANVVLPP